MSYLPQNVVTKNYKTRVRRDRNGREITCYEAYFGMDPFTKSAYRITRCSLKELMRDIKDFYMRHQAGGDAAVRLTAMEALDAKNALDVLATAGVQLTLSQVVSKYLDGATYSKKAAVNVTLGEAFDEFYRNRKTSETDMKMFRNFVGKWVEIYGRNRPISGVTAKEIQDYLTQNFTTRIVTDEKTGRRKTLEFKPKTYNLHLQYISTFFFWCMKEQRGYVVKNPAKDIERREIPWEEPQYLKPSEAEKVMRLLEERKDRRPDMLAYEIVNMFCGSRDIEVLRMAEENSANRINIEDETIRIANGKGFQLGRKPRAFHINATALAWMKSFDFLAAVKKITPNTKLDIYSLLKRSHVGIFKNFGRHTFITMHVAAYGDPSKTQAIVGTSEKMRADHYCGLASKAEGEAFFAIMPRMEPEVEIS